MMRDIGAWACVCPTVVRGVTLHQPALQTLAGKRVHAWILCTYCAPGLTDCICRLWQLQFWNTAADVYSSPRKDWESALGHVDLLRT